MPEQFHPHEINWTRKKSARFWDYLSSKASYQENNFGRLAGETLLKFLDDQGIRLSGKMLDFGCGPGFLLEYLTKRNLYCRGVEFSRASVELANNRLKGNPFFKGVELAEDFSLPFEAETFDAVFLLETIEHILPEEFERTLRELYRILKKNGYVIITTPNAENLEGGKIICPECGCIFHRGQHLSAWSKGSLSSSMAQFQFQKIVCEATTFRIPSKLNFLRDMVAWVRKHKKMNLVYIGQKK